MSRNGAKSRRRTTSLRSKTTKAKPHIDRVPAANDDLKKRLAEALEQQAATSEVLRVIASSPGELVPVFQAMLASATRICEAKCGTLLLFEEGRLRLVAMHGAPREFEELRRRDPTIPTYVRRLVETKQMSTLPTSRQRMIHT